MANLIPPECAPSVLVVDDHRDAADSLACLLPLIFDCTVHVAHSGAEALVLADRIAPQIVILDVTMPGMDGCETARRMRERPWGRQVRIITLSGWREDDVPCCGTLAAIDFHLTKPASIDALLGALALRRACVS